MFQSIFVSHRKPAAEAAAWVTTLIETSSAEPGGEAVESGGGRPRVEANAVAQKDAIMSEYW